MFLGVEMNTGMDRTVPSRVGNTVADVLENAVRRDGNRPYYTWRGVNQTVDEVNRASNRVARALGEGGVVPGSRVAVMMGSSPEYIAVWFALAKMGAVEVPINPAYKGELLRYQLQQASVELMIVDETHLKAVEPVAPSVASLKQLIVNGTDNEHYPMLSALFDEDLDDSDVEVEIAPESLACIMYTSGTTGPSKGVMLSQYGLVGFGSKYTEITALTNDDVVLNYSPFHHVSGKLLALACLAADARMVLADRFSVSSFWSDVRAEGITNFVAIGGVCNMLCGAPPRDDDADNPVRTVYAVPAPSQLYEEFERRFGLKLVEAYGSTEVGLVLSTSLDESIPGTCGRPNAPFEVAIVDDDGNELPAGEPGEIVVRTADRLLMCLGYDGMPEKTEEAWAGGWFNTGDRASRDEDGRFWFQDRIKDAIRRQGENISSYELEGIVGTHPDVSECAAIAAPSEVGEDEVRIVVVSRAGSSLDPEELFRYCNEHMAYFMVPRFIDIVDELPRTPTSKVEKYKLRTAGPLPTTWDAKAAGWRPTRHGLTRIAVANEGSDDRS